MEPRKISISMTREEWLSVNSGLAVGISCTIDLIKDLARHDNGYDDPEYLIKCYTDDLNHMRDAKAAIWRQLTK